MRRLAATIVVATVLLSTSLVAAALPPRGPGRAPVPEDVARTRAAGRHATDGATPGIAFQFRPCLAEEQRDVVRDRLARLLRSPPIAAVADVRSSCSRPGDFLNGVETLGVWLAALPAPAPYAPLDVREAARQADDARTRELGTLRLLGGDELFAWSLRNRFIEQLRQRIWDRQPRRLDEDGRPDARGPIHLQSLTFRITPPESVRTEVRGFHDAGPNTDFLMHIDSRLSVVRGKLVSNGRSQVDVDTDGLRWLAHLVTVVLPPLGLDLEDQLDRAEIAAGAPDGAVGLGTLIAKAAPDQLMTPGGRKIDFTHRRLEIAATEIRGGGTARDVRRSPAVAIAGPRERVVGAGWASLRFRIVPTDLRAAADAPLRVEWTADGRVARPDRAATDIVFRNFAAGRDNARRVSVRVTDADGLVATAAIDVHLHHEPGRQPPACRAKPWLPECGREDQRARQRSR